MATRARGSRYASDFGPRRHGADTLVGGGARLRLDVDERRDGSVAAASAAVNELYDTNFYVFAERY